MAREADITTVVSATWTFLLNGDHAHGSGYGLQEWMFILGGILGLLLVVAVIWFLSSDTSN